MSTEIHQPLIPVLCDKCGGVWFRTSWSLGGGGAVTVQHMRVHPCPMCGGDGHIPDGVYRATSIQFANPAERQLVINALSALRDKAARGADAPAIEEEISAKYPFLEGLKRYLPKDPVGLAAYLTLLLAVYAYFKPEKEAPAPIIQVQVHIHEALEKIASDLKAAPPERAGQSKDRDLSR